MYEVSERYKAAMKEPVLRFSLKGSVAGYAFTHEDIQAGSFSITNQCSEEGSVKIGSVYTAELKCTFMKDIGINRYAWMGAKIEVSEGLEVADGIYEYVPLGVFSVAEANVLTHGVEVVAYDNMAKFDVTYDSGSTTGTIYDLLVLYCRQCNVPLGITREFTEALPNGKREIALYPENDVETFRDMISWLAQTAACFATINRKGMLVLRPYNQTVVDEIDDYHRYQGTSFAAFITGYTGVSMVNVDAKKTEYYGLQVDNLLTYNLGSNPLIQYGVHESFCRNILNGLTKIYYTPFSVEMIGFPAYDLGDVIRFKGGRADEDTISCVMLYEYKFNSGYRIEGFGENPTLSTARSKVDKDLTGLMSQMDENGIGFYAYTNASRYEIGDGKTKEVCDIRFASAKSGSIIFEGTVLLNATLSEESEKAVCKVTYKKGGLEIDDFYPIETWEDGKHILNLFYPMEITDNTLSRWEVFITMEGASAVIEVGNVKAIIWGQALVGTKSWDGFLDFSEKVGEIDISPTFDMDVFSFTDDMRLRVYTPVAPSYDENVDVVSLFNSFDMEVANDFNEVLYVNKYPISEHIWAELVEHTWDYLYQNFTWA